MTSIILLSVFLIIISVVLGVVYFLTNKGEKESLTLKEFSVEVLIFLTLIPSVFSFIYILFMAIDKKFEDALNVSQYYNINSDLATFVSVLAVTFPLYLILAWMKYKNLKSNTERKNIKAFEYGIYLTIFFTGLFIIGSLITVIYTFLMGELGIAFLLKVLVVAIVSLLLFAYSYFSLKRNQNDFGKIGEYLPKIATFASLVLVITSIIYSISVIGSPMEMRKKKFDDLRLSNLSEIQNQILNYWQRENKLPESLLNIKSSGMDYVNINLKDPKTKENYKYNIVSQSELKKAFGEDCRKFYPNRYANLSDISKVVCDLPTDAKFTICANFETIRAYDENGVDQSGNGFISGNQYGLAVPVKAPSAYVGGMEMSYGYYGGGYDRNPNWNHPSGEYCFERTIETNKYTSFR